MGSCAGEAQSPTPAGNPHRSGGLPAGGAPGGRARRVEATRAAIDADALVIELFQAEGASLVRLARLFVDDRNAAEDLVQEAFIRLGRAAHRSRDPGKAAPYLRSIVLNLAANLVNWGIVPLQLEPHDGYDALAQGDELQVVGLRGLLATGRPPTVTNLRTGAAIGVSCALGPRERELVLAGGVLAQARAAVEHAGQAAVRSS